MILCEPFALPVNEVAVNWNEIKPELDQRRRIVQTLANEFDCLHVKLQETFNRACNLREAQYWLWDGVHPTAAGHALIAGEWLR